MSYLLSSKLGLYLVTRRGREKGSKFFGGDRSRFFLPALSGCKWLKIEPQTTVRFAFDLRYTLDLKIAVCSRMLASSNRILPAFIFSSSKFEWLRLKRPIGARVVPHHVQGPYGYANRGSYAPG